MASDNHSTRPAPHSIGSRPPIVFRMTGYANGGDAEWDQSSTHAGSWLNEGSPSRLSAGEIAAIVVIGLLLLLVTWTIFYSRTLQARRDIDMENKKALRLARAHQLHTLSVTSSGGSSDTRGDAIELRTKCRIQSDASPSAPETSEITPVQAPTARVCGVLQLPPPALIVTPRNLEAGTHDTDRVSLWHYIRWRDPFNGKYAKPPKRPRPRRVPADDFQSPTPYYES